jgi:predicted acylesterase/phospholipase RssA
MSASNKYARCMVLAGGGFRFGIYLGMYAAARDAGQAPDILLATCGGAIAAAIIQSLPDDAQRKAWLASPQMYRFCCELQSSNQAGIVRALGNAAQRKLAVGRARRVPDLFRDYLFEVPATIPLPAVAASDTQPRVAVAIVGAKLLFSPQDVLRPRAGRKLFVETVFCDPRTAALLQGMRAPWGDKRWGDHAISEELATDVAMPLADAVRISISDCFYFRCHQHGVHSYTGGLVDLFPIEISRQLAEQTMMEFKQSFDQTFSIPAWRAVLGLDGNQRLRFVHGQSVDRWVDTSDVSKALARQQVQKRLDWRSGRIRLVAPVDHATHMRHMDDQWNYGYQRGMEACKRLEPLDKTSVRQVDRYNRPEL